MFRVNLFKELIYTWSQSFEGNYKNYASLGEIVNRVKPKLTTVTSPTVVTEGYSTAGSESSSRTDVLSILGIK